MRRSRVATRYNEKTSHDVYCYSHKCNMWRFFVCFKAMEPLNSRRPEIPLMAKFLLLSVSQEFHLLVVLLHSHVNIDCTPSSA